MAFASLPEHLSHKAALILLPPASIQPPIQQLRRKHDRNFRRWPPHTNLIYPFLTSPSNRMDEIRLRITSAFEKLGQEMRPFSIPLRLNHASRFQHSKGKATIYLTSSDQDQIQKVKELQASLRSEFSECDADDRPFVPHLSLGQAKKTRGIAGLHEDLDIAMKEFPRKY